MKNAVYYPLSHPQQRIWYTEMMQQGTSFANICASMILKGNSVNIELLKKAINLAIRYNEALRIRIVHRDSGVQQYVADYQEVDLEVIQGSNIEEWLERQSQTPFGLINAPLSYFALVKYSEESYGYYIKLHHVIGDGFSFSILNKQIVEYYERLEKGQNIEETFRPSYFDYFNREEAYLASQQCTQDREYWLQRLADLPEPLTMGSASSKTDITSKRRIFRVSEDIQKKIDSFCHQHETTLFRFLLTAFSIYLARIYNNNDIIIGTAYFNRVSRKELNTIGMYVSTIPVRISVDVKSTFADLLNIIQQQLASDMAHQQYPYDLLVQDLRNAGQNPDGLLNINIVQIPNGKDHRLIAQDWYQGADLAILNMVINPRQLPKGSPLEIALDYRNNVFNVTAIERVFNCLLALIQDIVANHQKQLIQLEIMPEADRQQILALQGRVLDYDKKATFIDLFKKQVTKRPKNIAIVDENSSLTYEQTDLYSDRIAKELVRLGIKENTFVGIMLPRRKEFMVSVIGTMKAGGAYVPLDNEYPQERIKYMLEDSQTKVLITEKSIYEQKGIYAEKVIFIDEFDFATESNQDITFTASTSEDLAYMIYTSGSTGKPKGVMIRHKSLAAFLAWRSRDYQLTEKDNLCCHSSFSFDASVEDLFTALSVGGQLHIISEEMRQNMHELNQYFHDHTITGGTFSTQFGMELLNQFDLPLRYVIMGGEKLKPVKKTNIKMINGYGPTEFTICSSYHVVDQDKDGGTIPIGKPVANSWAYVVDGHNNLMPIGVAGELCMSGNQLALGYWNREDLTKEKFVDNPFQTCDENAKMYRTGDLVCWNENGELEYVGRIDNQVKLRGFRIELGEIESTMTKFDGITASVVEIKEIGKGQHLCGYFTADITINIETLREHLVTSLTEYMVPTFLMQLDKLPLTPNGKVDRKALPLPDIQGNVAYVAPRNETEAILASVFEMILDAGKIGIDDNFFALGGDSIKAIRMVSKLREKGVFVTVPAVMQGKTIRTISKTAACQDTALPIDQQPVVGQVPLTFIQSYFFEQNLPRPNHFNQSVVLESAQSVDEGLIRQVLQALTVHHDMLRAIYNSAGQQEICPVESEHLYNLTIYEYQEDNQWQSDMEVACNKMQKNFDLTSGPMLQAGLFRTPSADMLFLVIHHLVVDGISWRILIEDINTAYSQAMGNEPIKLPPKTVSFKVWSEAIRGYRASYLLKREIPYWKKVQDTLPTGFIPAAPAQEKGIGKISVAIDEAQTRALVSTASAAYHTEVNDLLLCALCRAVYKATGQTTVSVALEGHGREPIGENLPIDRTVGWFTSVYPIAFSEIGADIRRDIRRVKETMRRVPNHGIGYGILQYIGEPALEKQLQPDISFNYLGELSEEHAAELFTVNNQVPQGQSIYIGNTLGSPIAFNGLVKDKQLMMDVAYDKTKYNDAMIQLLSNTFSQELKTLISHCVATQTLELTASDLGEIAWNDTEFETLLAQTQAKGWEIERIYPLTPMQEGMLFYRLVESESTSYFLQSVFRLSHALSEDLLKQALYHLGQKHEVLRTAILYKEMSEPRQAILTGRDFEVNQADLSGYADTKDQLENIKRLDIKRGFDLQDDPLLRVTLVKMAEDDYRLLWSTHHIIIDGWCLSLIMNDFVSICNTLYTGQEYAAVGQKTGARYEDHIRSLLARDNEAARAYWRNILLGYSTEATIRPLGIPDGGVAQERTITYRFSKEDTEQIQKICKQYDVTINTAVEVAWGLVLQKYTNTEDVVFGKVVSGRNTGIAGAEEMVGLFINTIPVRVQTQQDETLGNLLIKVQQQAIESTQYDACALSEVQQLSDVGSKLIGTLIAFENYHIANNNVQQKAIDFTFEAAREQTNYGISVIANFQETLTVGISYHTTLYGEDEITRILESIAIVLTENPNVLCKDIRIINDEQLTMLERFNQTHTDYSNQCGSIVEMFKQQVEKTPNNIAVVYSQNQYTYQELDQVTDKLAKKLTTLGVGADQPVGVLIDRSEYMVIYPLAVLKAGAAYMPLDYSFPTERLEFMIQDAGVKLILSEQNRVEEHIPQFCGTVIKTEDISQMGTDETIKLPLPTPNDMFVILYTSGSTGTPKGCILENHNIVNFCKWHQAYFHITEEDRASAYANFGFDAHMLDIYPYITCGASTYILPSAIRLDFIRVNQFFEENSISIAFMTTQLGRHFVEQFDNKSLRALLVGGEKLLPIKKPAYQFYNGYGPTECTIFTTVYEITSDYSSAIIGRPLANYQLYVVDANLQLVPIGAAGELCIGGDGVSRGYLNREDVTQEKFIIWNGKRVYRTGDLVRWTHDGEIEYIGRMDGQVKLRGLRIELGEIESQILKYEGITNCAVAIKEIDVKDSPGEKYLCGYFTAPKPIELENLKKFLATNLPTFMVPSVFMQIPAIPFNQNGKINRKLLPIPDLSGSQNTYTAPRNENEKTMAAIWQEVLGIERVGIDDNFFDLGGHSLKASVMINKVKKVFQVEVAFRDVFSNPVLKDFVVLVNNGNKLSLPPIEKSEKLPAYPLLIPQKKMLDFALKNFGNSPLPLEITGKLDCNRLWQALEMLVDRQEILRSSITFLDDRPVQIIADTVVIERKVRQINIRDMEQAFREFVRPFTLSQPPLWRAELWELDTEHYILMLDIHHLIFDGSSIGILMKELVAAYEGKELPPLVIQFTDYAVWQDRLLQSGGFRNMENFWLKTLAGAQTSVCLPTDASRQAVIDYEGETVHSKLSPELTRQVYDLASQEKTTAHVVMMSAYSVLLAKYSGKDDIAFEEGIAGRNYPEIENLIGMFVNVIPIRSFPQSYKTFREFLREMNEALIRGYECQEYPVAKLAKQLNLTVDQDLGALQFDIGFVFQSMDIPQIQIADWEMKVYSLPPSSKSVARRELLLVVNEDRERLVLKWVYRSNLFNTSSIEKMAGDFSDILANLLAHPETKLEECLRLLF